MAPIGMFVLERKEIKVVFLFSEAIRRDTPPVTNKYVLIHNIVVMKAIVGEANVPSNGIKIIVNVCV